MEALITLLIDTLLALGVLGLAWRTLASPDLFKAIVLFIAFGLVMALVWVRLKAPDVALAEAAIGAGLTGALLLAAYAKLRITAPETNVALTNSLRGLHYISILILTLLLAGGLAYAIWPLPNDTAGLSNEVAANLHLTGVSNPVTAVLLNFRGYDTLLEVMVLLLALLGAWVTGKAGLQRDPLPDLVLHTLPPLLTPLLILVAVYLLWAGAHSPGGAFQAGALLSAAGVLLLLAGWQLPASLAALPLRLVLIVGPATFLILAVVTLLMEGGLLQYPPAWAGYLILIIETTAMISISATLIALFMGTPARKEE